MVALQKGYYLCHIILMCSLLFFSGCSRRGKRGPAPAPVPPSISQEVRPPAGLPRMTMPVIRVGLKTDTSSVQISGNGALYFGNETRTAGTKSGLIAAVSFVAHVEVRYTVQVGSFSARENALQARKEVESRTGQRAYVFENPDMHKFQVRLGPYPSQEKAQQAIEGVRGKGYPGAFYVAESSASDRLPELLVRDDLGNLLLKSKTPVHFWTESQIKADQKTYRGILIVFVNRTGRLTVINALNMENYLKGVVPGEIGPAQESTYEALKAQAVAARTYAYRNLGQFESEGYDLCATPRCQVYAGYDSEHVLTSRAVEETRGEILTYGGEAIHALYTSTCGGRTEHAQFVFEGWNYPYLRSVECYPEETQVASRSVRLKGPARPWSVSWLTLKTGYAVEGSLSGLISTSEAVESFASLMRYLGKTPCTTEKLLKADWISVADFFVHQLCWHTRKEALLQEKDYQYFLDRLEIPVAITPKTESFLFLFHEGILDPGERSGKDPRQGMTRSEFFESLYHLLDHYHQIHTREGQVREVESSTMQIVDDLGVHSYSFHNPIYLFQKLGETTSPQGQLTCGSGDSVSYYQEDGRIRLLACEVNIGGVSVDRSSKYSFWRETATPQELGRRISKYLDVGDVVDLEPLVYGVSRRVSELKVIGTKHSGILKGLRVRWGLGLRENLFVIDRVRDSRGRIKEFVFTGRGWGHGVGMCQIGALGFARQGKNYQFILKHYYSGVEISKVY